MAVAPGVECDGDAVGVGVGVGVGVAVGLGDDDVDGVWVGAAGDGVEVWPG